jgi:IS30 family transposase
VAQKPALRWSPEQIAGWLKRKYPSDPDMQISHEAIYRSLFIQSRGVLKKELTAHLRARRQMRRAKGAQTRTGQGQILDMVSIRTGPPKPRIAPSPVTGKAICSSAPATHASRRPSSGTVGSRCW